MIISAQCQHRNPDGQRICEHCRRPLRASRPALATPTAMSPAPPVEPAVDPLPQPLETVVAEKVLLPSDDHDVEPAATSDDRESQTRPIDSPSADELSFAPLHNRMATADPPCLVCMTPNPPRRRFCRKCGQTLTAFEIATPTDDDTTTTIAPWWRRLVSAQARLRYDNPISPKVRAVRGAALGGAALLGVAIIPPWGGGFRDEARSRVRKLVTSERNLPLQPEWVVETPEHPASEASFDASHVHDGSLELGWRSAAPSDQLPKSCDESPEAPGVVITFPVPKSIATLSVLASSEGASEDNFCIVIRDDSTELVDPQTVASGGALKLGKGKVRRITIVPLQPSDLTVQPSIPELKITTR